MARAVVTNLDRVAHVFNVPGRAEPLRLEPKGMAGSTAEVVLHDAHGVGPELENAARPRHGRPAHVRIAVK